MSYFINLVNPVGKGGALKHCRQRDMERPLSTMSLANPQATRKVSLVPETKLYTCEVCCFLLCLDSFGAGFTDLVKDYVKAYDAG